MSLTAVVLITLFNSGCFILLSDVYRRKTYRTRWKHQLIALMGAVIVIEIALLVTKFQEVLG